MHSRDLRRKKDILTEYETTRHLANQLQLADRKLVNCTLPLLDAERDAYWQKSIQPYEELNHKDYGWTLSAATTAGNKLASAVFEDLMHLEEGEGLQYELQNYNVQGRINGSKADLIAKVYADSELVREHKISLKAYERGGKIQVCSGTYVSTLLNFAFLQQGPGKYLTASGAKVPRATIKNIGSIAALFKEDYGVNIESEIKQLKKLDDNFKPLVYARYDKDIWKKACMTTAHTAIPLMLKVIDVIKASNPLRFKNKLLHMCGMDGGDDMVVLAGKLVYSTLHNPNAQNVIRRLSSNACTVEVGQKGQGIGWTFKDLKGDILSITMPLTINKNGAWWTEKTVNHRKNIHGCVAGDPREGKRNEIATSTNMYMRLTEIFGR